MPFNLEQNMLGMGGESKSILQDPQIANMAGTEEASDAEEGQLKEAMIIAQEWLYSEEGMAAAANVLQDESQELWQSIPEIGTMLLEKVHTDMPPDTDPSIYFGENGLIQQVPAMLFEVAEELGVPGSDNPDVLAAATIGLYKSVGEYLNERGDKDAREQALMLGQETLLTGDDGQMMTPEKFRGKALKESGVVPKQKGLAKNIKGLLGV